MSDLETIPELTADFIRRVVTYTEDVTYFGQNSVAGAFALATAQQTAGSEAQYRALLRRDTLLGAQGDDLERVAEEYGAVRLGPARAQTLVVVRPWSTNVTAITAATRIEVASSEKFEAGDSIRLTLDDGSQSEILTVDSIDTGTGPNGGDELVVGLIVGSYDPSSEDVVVLLRRTKPAGTVFSSTEGVAFESLEAVTTGDANPALLGESSALALADKVLCEAQTAGVAGNVGALTINSLETPDDDIRAVVNPASARGGEDTESEFALKYRAAHLPQRGAMETPAMLEVLAKHGNNSVMRALQEDSDQISTLRVRVLTRSGGGLSASEREALATFMSARLRSQLVVEVLNVVPTAIEVVAEVTLTPGTASARAKLRRAWRSAAEKLSAFLDWRKWPEGQAVDEADLISILKASDGIATVTTSSFQPAADTTVGEASIPMLTRLFLTDVTSGQTFGAVLRTSY